MTDFKDTAIADLISLKGRVIVVTGAASGIGYATARRLAQAGAIVIAADINDQKLASIRQELATDGDVRPIHMDITDEQSIKAVIASVDTEFGRLDAWLNIAGIYPGSSTLDLTGDEWKHIMEINFHGTFMGAQQAIKAMIGYGTPGVVVNVISTTMERPVPGLVHYTASKGGVKFMTRGLAKEFGPKGIRVLAVSPTITLTETIISQESGLAQMMGPHPFDTYAQQLPLGRLAQPDDIARVMLFAVSDLAAIMSGSVLFADAGETTV